MGQGVTGHENQSSCIQCGKQGTDHVPLNPCRACKTSKYCPKGCQVKRRTVHKSICKAIQELEKNKQLKMQMIIGTRRSRHLTPKQQPGLTKLVGWRCMVKCLIMGYRVPGLCCVTEVATNSLTVGGVKKC